MPYSVSPQVRRSAAGGKPDVELLDAHAERLGGDEVAELVHGDEQREAEDGDQPHPLAEQQRHQHGAAEQQRPGAQGARGSCRAAGAPSGVVAAASGARFVLCHVVSSCSFTIPVRGYVDINAARAARGSRQARRAALRLTGAASGAAADGLGGDAPRLGVAGVDVVERRSTGCVAEPVEALLDDLGDAEERRGARRGTPPRRPRWRRSARWARRPCAGPPPAAAAARSASMAFVPASSASARQRNVSVSGRSKAIAVANRSSRRTCGSAGRSGYASA